jgi:cytidylate kinase
LQKRYSLENERYFKLYGVRKEDESNYDLVLNTTNYTPEEVANKIIEEYKKWIEAEI